LCKVSFCSVNLFLVIKKLSQQVFLPWSLNKLTIIEDKKMSRAYRYLQGLNHTFKFSEQAPEYLRMFAGAGIAGFATYVITGATKSDEVRQSRKLYEEERQRRLRQKQRREQKVDREIARVEAIAELRVKQAEMDVKRLEQEKKALVQKAQSWKAAYQSSVFLWRVAPAHQTLEVDSGSQADSNSSIATP
jgi:hypothetical protein